MLERRIQRWMVASLLLGCGDDDAGPATLSGATMLVETTGVDTTGGSTDVPTTSSELPTTEGQGSGTGEPGTSTVGEVQCTADDECAQGIGACQAGACQAGVCVLVNTPKGTSLPDAPGNCLKSECDGEGALQQIADDSDRAVDPAGDCKRSVCEAGVPGVAPDDLDLPDDGVECTADTCDAGAPKFAAKPSNSPCGADGSEFCHDDLSCNHCKQVSAACEDGSNTEANETQQAAHELGTISDADSSGSFVCAALDGADDVDWYTFNGDDVFLNFVDPTREVITDQNHRICVYLTCDNGAPTIGCGGDETKDVAPGGQPGCCGTGNVSPSLNCAGTDDSATVWIKVENPDGLECVPYELAYHF